MSNDDLKPLIGQKVKAVVTMHNGKRKTLHGKLQATNEEKPLYSVEEDRDYKVGEAIPLFHPDNIVRVEVKL